MRNRRIVAAALVLLAGSALVGCANDANVVSANISKDSDNFKISRRVVFFNGITDKYLLSIEGNCSINDDGNQLEVTCKTGDNQYKKHFLGKSDNVTYFVEQLEGANVSKDHYKVTFKPDVIIPDFEKR